MQYYALNKYTRVCVCAQFSQIKRKFVLKEFIKKYRYVLRFIIYRTDEKPRRKISLVPIDILSSDKKKPWAFNDIFR